MWDQVFLAMMPNVEEHLGVHSVIEPAPGIGHQGKCGAEEYLPTLFILSWLNCGHPQFRSDSISCGFLASTFDTNANLTSSFISFGEAPRQWRMEDISFIRNRTFFPLSFFLL